MNEFKFYLNGSGFDFCLWKQLNGSNVPLTHLKAVKIFGELVQLFQPHGEIQPLKIFIQFRGLFYH